MQEYSGTTPTQPNLRQKKPSHSHDIVATLTVQNGQDIGKTVAITQLPFTIGRNPHPQIHYAMPFAAYISARHCSILYQNGQFEIIDHQSSNGTFLNDARLAPNTSYALPNQAQLKLGKLNHEHTALIFEVQPKSVDPFATLAPQKLSQVAHTETIGQTPLSTRPSERTKNLQPQPNATESDEIVKTFAYMGHALKPRKQPSDGGLFAPTVTKPRFLFCENPWFRYSFGGVLAMLATFLLLGVFALNWVSWSAEQGYRTLNYLTESTETVPNAAMQAVLQRSDFEASAFQIWLGRYSLTLDAPLPKATFSHVRWVDRGLILIAFVAACLLGVVLSYMGDWLPTSLAFGMMFGLALLLIGMPLAWQHLSTANWEAHVKHITTDTTEQQALLDAYKTQYNLNSYLVIAGLTWGVTLVGGLLNLFDQRHLLDKLAGQ